MRPRLRGASVAGDRLQECLDALGVRRQLWDREWIPEADLRAVCPDSREFARVLDRISRTEGLLLHLRRTKHGRIFLLERSAMMQSSTSAPGVGSAEIGDCETVDAEQEPITDAGLCFPARPPASQARLRPREAELVAGLESSCLAESKQVFCVGCLLGPVGVHGGGAV